MTHKNDIIDVEATTEELKDEYLAVEGLAREQMIEGFLKSGIKDKALNKLIEKYLASALYTEDGNYKLLDVIMGKMDALIIKQAKKSLNAGKKRRAVNKDTKKG